MMIKAARRSASMVVTGLFVCLAGVAYTSAPSEAASSKSESVTATKSVKQGTRQSKRYAHRKHASTAQKSQESSARKQAEEKEVADASGEMPVSLPPEVANANARIDARLDEPSGTTKAMTERANAILLAQADNKAENKPADAPAVAPAPTDAGPVVPPDQLNEVDRALQETPPALQDAPPTSQAQVAPAPPQTVAMATTAIKAGPPAQPPAAASNDSSTWDQTSLIGKIFIAFGALLTIASAARMFMA
jgi:hypothetical protein